jgi:hypothetical protein
MNQVALPEIRLVCANNNPRHGVQIFSLPSMQYITRLICPRIQDRTPVGGVQVSPNQKWILAVGDNLQVFLIRYNKEQEENEDKSQLYALANCIKVYHMASLDNVLRSPECVLTVRGRPLQQCLPSVVRPDM